MRRRFSSATSASSSFQFARRTISFQCPRCLLHSFLRADCCCVLLRTLDCWIARLASLPVFVSVSVLPSLKPISNPLSLNRACSWFLDVGWFRSDCILAPSLEILGSRRPAASAWLLLLGGENWW